MLAQGCTVVGRGVGSPSSTTLMFGSTVLESALKAKGTCFHIKKNRMVRDRAAHRGGAGWQASCCLHSEFTRISLSAEAWLVVVLSSCCDRHFLPRKIMCFNVSDKLFKKH